MVYADDVLPCIGVYSLRQAARGYEGPVVQCIRKTQSGYDFRDFTSDEIGDPLENWADGENVHVSRLYNQTDGPDVTQTALEAQPVICIQGKILRRKNRPVILQRVDGSLDVTFSSPFDLYLASFVGGADYQVERPTLYELPMSRSTTRRRVVTRRDKVWSYLGKKYLSSPVLYGETAQGLTTHTIRHMSSRIEAWQNELHTEATGTDPAETDKLTLLNSKRGQEQGSYLAEFVIATGNTRSYQARQLHLWQKSYYG